MKPTFAPEASSSISLHDTFRSAAASVKNHLSGTVCIIVASIAIGAFLVAIATANVTMTVTAGLAALLAVAAGTSDSLNHTADSRKGGAA